MVLFDGASVREYWQRVLKKFDYGSTFIPWIMSRGYICYFIGIVDIRIEQKLNDAFQFKQRYNYFRLPIFV